MNSVYSATLRYYNANSRGANQGDCTVRSISTAYRMDYDEVHTLLLRQAKESNLPSYRNKFVSLKLIKLLGFEERRKYDNPKTVGEFADSHPSGTYIIYCSSVFNKNATHAVALINGQVVDSWDSRDWYIDEVVKVDGRDKLNDDDEPFRELSGLNIYENFIDELDNYLRKLSKRNKYIDIYIDETSPEFYDSDYKIYFEAVYDYSKLWEQGREVALAVAPETEDNEYSVPIRIGYNPAKSEEYNSSQLLKKLKQKLYDKLYEKTAELKKRIESYESNPDAEIDYKLLKSLPSWSTKYVLEAIKFNAEGVVFVTLESSDGKFFKYRGKLSRVLSEMEEDKYLII